jgi:hypothetical protein
MHETNGLNYQSKSNCYQIILNYLLHIITLALDHTTPSNQMKQNKNLLLSDTYNVHNTLLHHIWYILQNYRACVLFIIPNYTLLRACVLFIIPNYTLLLCSDLCVNSKSRCTNARSTSGNFSSFSYNDSPIACAWLRGISLGNTMSTSTK